MARRTVFGDQHQARERIEPDVGHLSPYCWIAADPAAMARHTGPEEQSVGPPELARVHARFVSNGTGASAERPSACLPVGERGVYDSALGFLSLVFRIHGVQPDAPTEHRFQRPVAGPPSVGLGGPTWFAGSEAEGFRS